MDIPRHTSPLGGRIAPIALLLYAALLIGTYAIAHAALLFGLPGLAVTMLPAGLCFIYLSIKKPVYAFLGLFVINYLVMGISRYLPEQPMGTLLDLMIFYNLAALTVHSIFYKVKWRRANTWLTWIALIWLVYGVLQLFNPETISSAGWFSSVRSVSFHFFFIVVLTQIIIDDFRYIRYILFMWSIMTLLAVAKALVQKFIGFDQGELHWLFALGGHTTHIIYSGARYFSFFSDAANFSASMGMSMVVFLIMAFSVEKKWIKYYFILVAIAACYGLLISGTRSALAIPFVGFGFYVVLSKRTKIVLIGSATLIALFCFLNFTSIGQGNAIIRRTRSAFDTSDPSLQVRLENQKKLRELMADKPFGAGVGHGGGKAKTFAPDAPISQIPTDSWYVLIWVETGVVGIVMHLMMLFSIVGYGAYLVMFKLQNPQLRATIGALTSGILGVMAMSYANEVLGQIPMGVVVFMSTGLIFLSPSFDRQLCAVKKP